MTKPTIEQAIEALYHIIYKLSDQENYKSVIHDFLAKEPEPTEDIEAQLMRELREPIMGFFRRLPSPSYENKEPEQEESLEQIIKSQLEIISKLSDELNLAKQGLKLAKFCLGRVEDREWDIRTTTFKDICNKLGVE